MDVNFNLTVYLYALARKIQGNTSNTRVYKLDVSSPKNRDKRTCSEDPFKYTDSNKKSQVFFG